VEVGTVDSTKPHKAGAGWSSGITLTAASCVASVRCPQAPARLCNVDFDVYMYRCVSYV
jgi:hypothetical protein